MVRATLVETDILEGQELISALRQSDLRFAASHFVVRTAFWLFDEESMEWRLIIATPLVDERGLRSAYTDIQSVLQRLSLSLTLQNITVISPDDDLVKAIKKIGKVPKGSIGLRIGRTRVNDVLVDDAFVYSQMDKAA